MKKKYFVHKYLLLQLIIGYIVISTAIVALMISFYFSKNFDGASYMLLLVLLTIAVFMCIIFVPIFNIVSIVEIDSDKIMVKKYNKIVAELFWKEELILTEKLIGGAKYLVITGANNTTVLFCNSKSAVKHILSVCSNEYIIDQLKLKYKML